MANSVPESETQNDVDQIFFLYRWWYSSMDRSHAPDTTILRHYIDTLWWLAMVLIHYFNKLLTFFCIVKISYNSRNSYFKVNLSVAATEDMI